MEKLKLFYIFKIHNHNIKISEENLQQLINQKLICSRIMFKVTFLYIFSIFLVTEFSSLFIDQMIMSLLIYSEKHPHLILILTNIIYRFS